LLLEQGEARFAAGDVPGARACFKGALSLAPGKSARPQQLGVLAFGLGNIGEAILHLEHVLRDEPDHVSALENLARCREAQGDFREASGSGSAPP
jgi:predicted Zn-dependent protease